MADLASQVQGFTGILQVDGYGSYKGLARRHPQIQLAFCLAHARRKFVAVYKATHAPLARDVIAALSEVYAIEARIRGRCAAERRAVRQAETKPILEALKTRLMTALADLPSRSSLVEAIKYMLGHWAGLTLFLEDGRIEVGRVEDGRGSLGLVWQRSVSRPRSSNRTCGFPASGFLPIHQTFALGRSARRIGTR